MSKSKLLLLLLSSAFVLILSTCIDDTNKITGTSDANAVAKAKPKPKPLEIPVPEGMSIVSRNDELSTGDYIVMRSAYTGAFLAPNYLKLNEWVTANHRTVPETASNLRQYQYRVVKESKNDLRFVWPAGGNNGGFKSHISSFAMWLFYESPFKVGDLRFDLSLTHYSPYDPKLVYIHLRSGGHLWVTEDAERWVRTDGNGNTIQDNWYVYKFNSTDSAADSN